MATIYLSLSAKTDTNPLKELRIRFKHGSTDQQAKTNIFIPVEYWNDEAKQIIVPNFRLMNEERAKIKKYLTDQNERLSTLIARIQTSFNDSDKKAISNDWLKTIIDSFNFPEKYVPKITKPIQQSFFDAFDEFLGKRKLSEVREKNYMVLKRALQRYELFISVHENRNFKLELDSITGETITDFESFLRNEHILYDEYKDIYDKFPSIINTKRKVSKPQPRGMNTINGLFNKLRAFFNWCNDTEKTNNRPFRNYESVPDLYGTPVYISIDERNTIYRIDLSSRPKLAMQRDIFVFQCLVGCRVGDLFKMTKGNIINGAIEYIPRKTKDGHPVTVRVPLNDIAKEIIKRYEFEQGMLLPFISEQRYNDAIKEIFKIAGIIRIVTVINPTTRNEEKRPINEIASSHLARRTFVGNLYKQVKDPNLVGVLSGHKEGSRAFARYREIDEEIKLELVKMLE